jgi:hypothetical protein
MSNSIPSESTPFIVRGCRFTTNSACRPSISFGSARCAFSPTTIVRSWSPKSTRRATSLSAPGTASTDLWRRRGYRSLPIGSGRLAVDRGRFHKCGTRGAGKANHHGRPRAPRIGISALQEGPQKPSPGRFRFSAVAVPAREPAVKPRKRCACVRWYYIVPYSRSGTNRYYFPGPDKCNDAHSRTQCAEHAPAADTRRRRLRGPDDARAVRTFLICHGRFIQNTDGAHVGATSRSAGQRWPASSRRSL